MARIHFLLHAAALAPALAALLPAQNVPALPSGAFRTPLHQPADETTVWTSGDTWKASFDAGFAFYPLLGADAPENLPLRWDTTAFKIGAHELELAAPARQWTDTRYELVRGPITERYDVQVEGIEQSFVFASLPYVDGKNDLVIEGRIASALRATPRAGRHDGLDFADAAGVVRVRYGAAFVLDAAGRKAPIASSFDGTHIALRVDGAWLASATFPVTVDPLTAPVIVGSVGSSDAASYTTIGRDDLADELMVGYARAFAANDFDLFLRLQADDFSGGVLAYSDESAARSTRRVSLDFVRGPARWVAAFGIEGVANHRVRVYFHDSANHVAWSGSQVDVPLDFANHDADPSFGGCVSSGYNYGFLAFRRENGAATTNNSDSQVTGCLVNASSRTVGARMNLHTAGTNNYDAEFPYVSPQATSTEGWVVAWQEYNYDNANDDWDIVAQRIDASGGLFGMDVLGNQASASVHKLRPVVAGSNGRYLVAFTTRTNSGKNGLGSGDELRTQRFDWSLPSPTATVATTRVISSSATPNILLRENNSPIAFDTRTRSHWSIAWHRADVGVSIARVGFEGRVVEEQVAFATNGPATGFWPSVTFDDDAQEFPFAFATNSSVPAAPVFGMRLGYRSATQSSQGTGCAGALTATNALVLAPFAGSEFFTFRVSGARPSAPTWLFASIGILNQPLPYGGPGCVLLLNTAVPLTEAGAGFTNAAGAIDFPFPLPDTIATANVAWQAVQLDAGMLWSTQALVTSIR